MTDDKVADNKALNDKTMRDRAAKDEAVSSEVISDRAVSSEVAKDRVISSKAAEREEADSEVINDWVTVITFFCFIIHVTAFDYLSIKSVSVTNIIKIFILINSNSALHDKCFSTIQSTILLLISLITLLCHIILFK